MVVIQVDIHPPKKELAEAITPKKISFTKSNTQNFNLPLFSAQNMKDCLAFLSVKGYM